MHCAGGVPVPRGLGLPAPRGVGVPASGGVCSLGVSALGEGWVSKHALRQTPPPMNRMTDRCKNITLPQTSFAGGNYSRGCKKYKLTKTQ